MILSYLLQSLHLLQNYLKITRYYIISNPKIINTIINIYVCACGLACINKCVKNHIHADFMYRTFNKQALLLIIKIVHVSITFS